MTNHDAVSDSAAQRPTSGSYVSFVRASFLHNLAMQMRRKRLLLAALTALTPAVVPVLMAMFGVSQQDTTGATVFVNLIEEVYLKAIAPLLAIFFGCSLIGEDVELVTIPYVLTRPIPRSSIVFGRFLSYLLVASIVLVVSMVLTMAGCTTLGSLPLSTGTIELTAQYSFVGVMALLGYGALTVFLGAITRRPIIASIVIIFFYQQLLLRIPGLLDFFTILKYTNAMLPVLPTQRANPVFQTVLGEYQKEQLLVSAPTAVCALVGIALLFLGLSCAIMRWREFSTARAIG